MRYFWFCEHEIITITPPPHKNAVNVIVNYFFILGMREHHVSKLLIKTKKINKGLL